MPLALGIEIGGTKLQAGVGDGGPELKSLVRRAIDVSRGGAGIREALPEIAAEAASKAGLALRDLAGVGVGFGGPVDGERVIVSNQVEGWAGFPLRSWLADRLGRPVLLQNDCKAAALAEYAHGAGKGCRRIFYVTVGSGIGGGLVVDGRVDVGLGLGAGEIGHTWVPDPATGKPEKLELVASGWSIGKRGGRPAPEVYAAAERGDVAARGLIEETAATLGLGMANVAALLCPERFILGGGVSLMGPIFWDALRASLEARLFGAFRGRVAVVPAGLGEAVVVHGAVRFGLEAS